VGKATSTWTVCSLADTAERGGLVGGPFGSSLGTKDYVECGVPVIRGQNLGGPGRFDSSEFVYVTESKADELRRNLALPGDIVFTQRGTLGQVGIVPSGGHSRYVISQSQMRLRPEPTVAHNEYIYYVFRSPSMFETIHARAIVTGVPHINLGILAELAIELPPIDEQRAIAGVLGALDDKIESNRRIATGCERLLSAFVALVPEHSLVPMSEIAHSTRVSVDPAELGDELVDHFSIPAYDMARLPELCSASTIKSGKFLVERRSVLVSRLNPSTPRVWLADPNGRKAICSTEFLVLGPRDGQVLATVWLAAVSATFLAEAERRATGTSFSHQRIKPDDALTIEVPDMRLLQASQLAEAEAWLERALVARSESAATSALRDALLPELLSGRIRVRDAEKVAEEAV
jgi:type I restriction enzyme S subunit